VQSAGRRTAAVVTVSRCAGRKEKVLLSHAEQRVFTGQCRWVMWPPAMWPLTDTWLN